LLCQGIQQITGWPSLLLPENSDPATALRVRELPATGLPSNARPNHVADRTRLIQCFRRLGWRSLCSLYT